MFLPAWVSRSYPCQPSPPLHPGSEGESCSKICTQFLCRMCMQFTISPSLTASSHSPSQETPGSHTIPTPPLSPPKPPGPLCGSEIPAQLSRTSSSTSDFRFLSFNSSHLSPHLVLGVGAAPAVADSVIP